MKTVDMIPSASQNWSKHQLCSVNRKFVCTLMPICQQTMTLKHAGRNCKLLKRLFFFFYWHLRELNKYFFFNWALATTNPFIILTLTESWLLLFRIDNMKVVHDQIIHHFEWEKKAENKNTEDSQDRLFKRPWDSYDSWSKPISII